MITSRESAKTSWGDLSLAVHNGRYHYQWARKILQEETAGLPKGSKR